ncbi:hypothetical protein K440DRAFT_127390 [Wilcoxina mikolae CBS 423.85]|nr:hypothetical protein K440DRAFT_127390 [Wilcoxina mikolae CBS 423.85]
MSTNNTNNSREPPATIFRTPDKPNNTSSQPSSTNPNMTSPSYTKATPSLTTPQSRPVAKEGSSNKRARQDVDAKPVTSTVQTPAPARRITKLKNVPPQRRQERQGTPIPPPATPGGLDRAPFTSFGRPIPATAPRPSFLYFKDQEPGRMPDQPLQLFGGSNTRSNNTGKSPDVSASFPVSEPLSSTAIRTKATSQSFGGDGPIATPAQANKMSDPPRTTGSGFIAKVKQKVQNTPILGWAAGVQARIAKRENERRATSVGTTSSFESATPSGNEHIQAVSKSSSIEGDGFEFSVPPVAQSTPTGKGKAVVNANSPVSTESVQSKPPKSWDGRVQQTTSYISDKVQNARDIIQSNKESKRAHAKELAKVELRKMAEEQERVRRDAIMKQSAEELEAGFVEESTEVDTEVDSDVEISQSAPRPQESIRTPVELEQEPVQAAHVQSPKKPEVVELSSDNEQEYFSSEESYQGDNDSNMEDEPVTSGPGRSYGLTDSFFDDTTEIPQPETPNENLFQRESIVILDSDDEEDTGYGQHKEDSRENSIVILDSDNELPNENEEDEDEDEEEEEQAQEEEEEEEGDESNVVEPSIKQEPTAENEPTVMDAPTTTDQPTAIANPVTEEGGFEEGWKFDRSLFGSSVIQPGDNANQPIAVASPIKEEGGFEEGWTQLDRSLFGTSGVQPDEEGESLNAGSSNAPILLSSDSENESGSDVDKPVHIKQASFYDHAASSVGEPSDDDGTGEDIEQTNGYDDEDAFIDEISYEAEDEESIVGSIVGSPEGFIPDDIVMVNDEDENDDGQEGCLTEEEALAGLTEEEALNGLTEEGEKAVDKAIFDEEQIGEDQSFQNAEEQVKEEVLENAPDAPIANETTTTSEESFITANGDQDGTLKEEAPVDPETKGLDIPGLPEGNFRQQMKARRAREILDESFDDTMVLGEQITAALHALDDTVVQEPVTAEDESPPSDQIAQQELLSSVIDVTVEVKEVTGNGAQHESADMPQGVLSGENLAANVNVKEASESEPGSEEVQIIKEEEEDIYEETFGEATIYDDEPTETDVNDNAVEEQLIQEQLLQSGPVGQAFLTSEDEHSEGEPSADEDVGEETLRNDLSDRYIIAPRSDDWEEGSLDEESSDSEYEEGESTGTVIPRYFDLDAASPLPEEEDDKPAPSPLPEPDNDRLVPLSLTYEQEKSSSPSQDHEKATPLSPAGKDNEHIPSPNEDHEQVAPLSLARKDNEHIPSHNEDHEQVAPLSPVRVGDEPVSSLPDQNNDEPTSLSPSAEDKQASPIQDHENAASLLPSGQNDEHVPSPSQDHEKVALISPSVDDYGSAPLSPEKNDEMPAATSFSTCEDTEDDNASAPLSFDDDHIHQYTPATSSVGISITEATPIKVQDSPIVLKNPSFLRATPKAALSWDLLSLGVDPSVNQFERPTRSLRTRSVSPTEETQPTQKGRKRKMEPASNDEQEEEDTIELSSPKRQRKTTPTTPASRGLGKTATRGRGKAVPTTPVHGQTPEPEMGSPEPEPAINPGPVSEPEPASKPEQTPQPEPASELEPISEPEPTMQGRKRKMEAVESEADGEEVDVSPVKKARTSTRTRGRGKAPAEAMESDEDEEAEVISVKTRTSTAAPRGRGRGKAQGRGKATSTVAPKLASKKRKDAPEEESDDEILSSVSRTPKKLKTSTSGPTRRSQRVAEKAHSQEPEDETIAVAPVPKTPRKIAAKQTAPPTDRKLRGSVTPVPETVEEVEEAEKMPVSKTSRKAAAKQTAPPTGRRLRGLVTPVPEETEKMPVSKTPKKAAPPTGRRLRGSVTPVPEVVEKVEETEKMPVSKTPKKAAPPAGRRLRGSVTPVPETAEEVEETEKMPVSKTPRKAAAKQTAPPTGRRLRGSVTPVPEPVAEVEVAPKRERGRQVSAEPQRKSTRVASKARK